MSQQNTETIAQIKEDNGFFPSPYFQAINNRNGVILGICLILVLLLNFLSDDKKGKLASGRWGGKKERDAAKKKAKKQMSKVSRNSVALYIGSSKPNKK